MAVYGNKNTNPYSPEDVKYVTTYEHPVMDLKYVDNLNKQNRDYIKEDITNLGKNVDSIFGYKDDLLNIKVDNEYQKIKLEELKAKHGVSEDLFKQFDINSLKSPYASRGIGTKIKSLMADPEMKKIAFDTFTMEEAMKKIPNISDPDLRKLAVEEFENYKRDATGSFDARQYSVDDYKPVDIDKSLIEIANQAPSTSSAEVQTKHGKVYTVTTEGRDKDYIDQRTIAWAQNPTVRKNLIAKGYMDKDGNFTEAFVAKRKTIVDAFSKPSTKIGALADVNLANDAPRSSKTANDNPFKAASQERLRAVWDQLREYGVDEVSDTTLQQMMDEANAAQAFAQVSKDPSYSDKGYDEIMKGVSALQPYDPVKKMGNIWIEKDPDGSLVIVNDALDPTKGYFQRRTPINVNRKAGTVQISGDTLEDTKNLFKSVEADSRGFKSVNAESAALGSYQIVPSYHQDSIVQAVKDRGIDVTQYETPLQDAAFESAIKTKVDSNLVKKENVPYLRAFLMDEAAQDHHFKTYILPDEQKVANELKAEGLINMPDGSRALTDVELTYVVHNLGPKGAREWLRSGAGNPLHIERVVDALDKMNRSMQTSTKPVGNLPAGNSGFWTNKAKQK